MKSSLLITLCLLSLSMTSQAQSKLREKDVIGNWKLVIDINEELKEAQDEMEEEDNFLGEIILGSVTGLVNGIFDHIDIYMEFRKGGELKTLVNAFGETEIEYSKWWIDDEGKLRISSDNKHFSSDSQDYWLLKDGNLISFENGDDMNENIHLVNID